MTSDEYQAWVEDHSGWATDRPERTCFRPEPGADAVSGLIEAKAHGVERMVCGFLPDEVTLPGEVLTELLVWLQESLVFLPPLLPRVESASGEGQGLLLVQDAAARGLAEGSTALLATSWAAARDLPFERTEVAAGNLAEVAHALGGAEVIVNDVRDWSIGFAVDHAAARMGRRCIRLMNPGYSPLRHALLGRILPSPAPGEVERIRRELTDKAEPAPPHEIDAWFSARESTLSLWRDLIAVRHLRRFWLGANWPDMVARAAEVYAGAPWLDRLGAWPLLFAAGQVPAFPRQAWERAVDAATAWLSADRRARKRGRLREQALPRWLRLQPGWLETFRQQAGDTPQSREAVGRWVEEGVRCHQLGTPALPLASSAAWALEEKSPAGIAMTAIRAWADDWAEIIRVGGTTSVPPAWRCVCVEAWKKGLDRLRSPGRRGEGMSADALLANPAPWSACFGAAGPILRIVSAVAAGRPAVARATWRASAQSARIEHHGGWARLVRSAFSSIGNPLDWLVQAAAREASATGEALADVVAPWYRQSVWGVWRLHPDASVRRELEIALGLIGWAAGQPRAPFAVCHLHAVLSALAGRAGEARAAMARLFTGGKPTGDLPALVAMALWLRGQAHAGREVLGEAVVGGAVPDRVAFTQAVACQLLGDEAGVARALTRLRQVAPAYLAPSDPPDGRLVWTAALLQLAGQQQQATRVRASLRATAPGVPPLLDELEPRGESLHAAWTPLLERCAAAAS